MAQYTVELGEMLDSGYELGLNKYPIFSESYRAQLNQKIKDHYRFYEIGFETPERFTYELNRKMNEIMIYYNQMYESELIEINPLLTYSKDITSSKNEESSIAQNEAIDESHEKDMKRSQKDIKDDDTTLQSDTEVTSNKNVTEQSKVTGDNSTTTSDDIAENLKEKNVGSDTPSELILGGDITGDVYATRVTLNDSTRINDATRSVQENIIEDKTGEKDENISEINSNKQTLSNDSKVEITEDVSDSVSKNKSSSKEQTGSKSISDIVSESGFDEALSKLLNDYRTTFLNIDMMIINSLRSLFMQIY